MFNLKFALSLAHPGIPVVGYENTMEENPFVKGKIPIFPFIEHLYLLNFQSISRPVGEYREFVVGRKLFRLKDKYLHE